MAPAKPLSPGLFGLTDAGEPFRLLFPLGIILGGIGVMLWPLYVWGEWIAYPAVPHQRIMIEGFLTAFVIGFLGTALPRLLDVPRVRLPETLANAGGLIAVTSLHLGGETVAGDVGFLLLLAGWMARLVWRLRLRRDTPPPAFVLVAMGLISAVMGTMLQILIPFFQLPAFAYPLASLLLYQAYLLLPVMGIGAFLLPRFFGLPNQHDFPESLALPPGWLRKAGVTAAFGLGVMASFVLEACGWVTMGTLLRAVLIFGYFLREVPMHRAQGATGSLGLALRLSLYAIPLGYLLVAIWPQWRMAWMHVVFITGFNLLTFTVASRVMLGHGGRSHLFRQRLWPVLTMMACLIIAMISRVGGDWLPPSQQMAHYAYAALIWLIGTVIWAFWVLPSIRHADAE